MAERNDTIILGNVSITRVVEWSGPLRTGREIFPDSAPETWQEHRKELVPDFWRPENDSYLLAIQSWVIRSGGMTLIVDTGAGNDRNRPQVPQFHQLRTPFLDSLARSGVEPETVDIVVNTHVHYDHVGWNTQLRDGEWQPTFPNATYLIPRIDRDYFDPVNEHLRQVPRTDGDRLRRRGSHLVFEDSVAPILREDRAVLWQDDYRIDANLTLEPAPGHTPGSSRLHLRSGSDRAVFVGDMLHSPVQFHDPDVNSCFCENPEQARATRRRVLAEAADTRTLVVPAHFPGHGATEISRDGDSFAVRGWARLGLLHPGTPCVST